MINDNASIKGVTAVKAMVQRHDDKPIPGHWRQLQNIKNELFGTESTAIEFYPPESELEDVANIYWLWVIPPESAFHKQQARIEELERIILNAYSAGEVPSLAGLTHDIDSL